MDYMLVAFAHGIITGGVYGVIALGLSLIFGILRVINFAHGSMLMVSTYLYYCLWKYCNLDPYFSTLIVVPLMFAFGYFFQHFAIKPLFERERALVLEPISVLILTCGLWIFLDNLMLMIFGADFLTINTSLSDKYLNLGLLVIQVPKIIAFIGSIILVVAFDLFLKNSELGKVIRATAQNRDAVSLCGIDVYKIFDITFGIGVAFVSIAGAFLIQFYYVNSNIGSVFGVKSFLIVVLGGLGSVPGALLGGLIFGIVESVGAQFMPSSSASMLTFLLFIIVLFFRPQGLMGKIKG